VPDVLQVNIDVGDDREPARCAPSVGGIQRVDQLVRVGTFRKFMIASLVSFTAKKSGRKCAEALITA
jgi:hypothetical protein